jgi:hypothetical protein
MDDLEQVLKDSLRREEPPAGFESRLLAMTRRRAVWRPWLAAAAALIIGGGVGLRYEQDRRERERGEAARAQLELALRIASAKLQKVQKTIESHSQRDLI